MKKNSEWLPNFGELAKRMPELRDSVFKLFEYLDVWSIRSMTVKGKKCSVMALEFVIPSKDTANFTNLVRNAKKMSPTQLGTQGLAKENETLRWAVSGYQRATERALGVVQDILDQEQVSNSLFHQRQLDRLTKQLLETDASEIGIKTRQEYRDMEKRIALAKAAVDEKRPDIAAELICQLDDD